VLSDGSGQTAAIGLSAEKLADSGAWQARIKVVSSRNDLMSVPIAAKR
jgi:hypothetical protein